MILEFAVIVLVITVFAESFIFALKMAKLEGMCYGLIATIQGMEKEREKNADD